MPSALLVLLVVWLTTANFERSTSPLFAAGVNFSSDITIDPIDFSITASTSTPDNNSSDSNSSNDSSSSERKEDCSQGSYDCDLIQQAEGVITEGLEGYSGGFSAYETSTAEILSAVDNVTDQALSLVSDLNISEEVISASADEGGELATLLKVLEEYVSSLASETDEEKQIRSESWTEFYDIKETVGEINAAATPDSVEALDRASYMQDRIYEQEAGSDEFYEAYADLYGTERAEERKIKDDYNKARDAEIQIQEIQSAVELDFGGGVTSTVGDYIDSLDPNSSHYLTQVENYYGTAYRQKLELDMESERLFGDLQGTEEGTDKYFDAYEAYYGTSAMEEEKERIEVERISAIELEFDGGLTSTVGNYVANFEEGSEEHLSAVEEYYGVEYRDKREVEIEEERILKEKQDLVYEIGKLTDSGLFISEALTSTVGDYIAILEEGSEEHLNAVEEYYGTEYRRKVEQDIQMDKLQKEKELEQETLRLEEETLLQQISEKGNVELTLLDGMTTTVVSMVDSLAYGSDDHLEAIEEHYGVEYLERVEKDIENQIMLQKVADAEYGSAQYLIAFEEYYGEAAAEVEVARLNEEKLIQKVNELSSIEIMMVSAGLTSTVGSYISKLDYGSSYHLRELERFYGDEYRYTIEQEIEQERLDKHKKLEEEELLIRIQELSSAELTVTSKGITSTATLTILDESLKDTEEIPTSVEEIDEEVSGPDDVIDITDTKSNIDVAEVEENIDAEKSDVIDLIQLVNPEEEIPLELNSAVVNELNELGYSFSGHRRY
tara:strand:+ start:483 stop:2831 length:2349 start_codon:yes stop_codon:yes gene_type:complete